jgi:DNA recombination-dependent growth factor C
MWLSIIFGCSKRQQNFPRRVGNGKSLKNKWIMILLPPGFIKKTTIAAVIGDEGTMLVHVDDGGIDHLHRRIVSHRQRIHDLILDASPPPANMQ